jgi:diguanylate cyclase (GGDEF)-like protein
MNSYGKHFWLTSIVAAVATIGTLSGFYEWHSKRLIIEAETRADLQLVQTLGNMLWPKHGAFIQLAKSLPKEQLSQRPEQTLLFDSVRTAVRDSPVLKVKIFAPKTGLTLFSTEAKQIGDLKHGSVGLMAAIRGEKNAELSHRKTFNGISGVVINRDLVASYIPFYENGRPRDGSPEMILEIYTDVTELIASNATSRSQIVLAVSGGLSLMYAVIFFFGRRTSLSLKEAERKRKRLDAKIRHQAYHDSLTGLANRACFVERLKAQHLATALNVLFIDLDQFKIVNDSLGHKAGDQVLAIIAKRLRSTLSKGDQIFRVGGDEFVLLQNNPDPMQGHLLAQSIVREVAPSLEIDGTKVTLTASVGIARWPLDDASLEGAVRCADIAMYAAKGSGSNQLALFREEMREEIEAQATLMTELKCALTNSEFILHYQPRLNSKTRRIESVEALIRWNHPELGLLFPEKFIAALEDSALIVDVGRWVLQAAAEQAMRWRSLGNGPIKVSVNVAPKQFRHANFVSSVIAVLKNSGLPASDLELEITEGQVIGNLDSAIEVLSQLKALGVSVAIDDFGTGYSSLSYLHRLPINCLKIDRSFVKDVAHNSSHGKIAQTITMLAHSLGLSVVAEGVETSYQADTLTHWGCEQLQGYLFSKPVAQELIPALVAQSTSKTKTSGAKNLHERLLEDLAEV